MSARRGQWALSLVTLPVLVAGALVACTSTPERSTTAFCQQVVPVQSLDQVLATGDAAKVRAQVGLLRVLQEVAPSDIEPQVARLVGITDELSHVLGTTPDPDVAADEVFRRHQGDLADIASAGAALERYAATNCGIVLNPTGSSPVGSTSTTAPGGSAPGPTVSGSAPR